MEKLRYQALAVPKGHLKGNKLVSGTSSLALEPVAELCHHSSSEKPCVCQHHENIVFLGGFRW